MTATPCVRRCARRTSRRCAASSSSAPITIRSRTSILVKVAKRADGKYQTEIVERVFADYADVYAKDCAMK